MLRRHPAGRYIQVMEAKLHQPHPLSIGVSADQTVSGLLLAPERPSACLVLAHGAGAGMTHPFMTAVALAMHDRGVATLRYQFPYMEKGSRRPDSPAIAQATVRAAVDAAKRHFPDMPLIAGGKSFGGRMTSQAQANEPLPGVRGLAFLGFPLHPAGKPSVARAQHLKQVQIPLLFLQGDRDLLATAGLIGNVASELGERATLVMFPAADHSFHVPARGSVKQEQVMDSVFDALADWIHGVGLRR